MSNQLYVLTGGLATGKTELIRGLSDRGYNTYPELEQSVLEEFFKDTNPKDNPILYASEWFEKKRNQYDLAIQNGQGFFDRGFLDPLSVFLFLDQQIPTALKAEINEARYNPTVFLVEQIPKEWYGGIWPKRLLSEGESKKFEEITKDFYRGEGYDIVAVPPMSVNNRVDFIANHI